MLTSRTALPDSGQQGRAFCFGHSVTQDGKSLTSMVARSFICRWVETQRIIANDFLLGQFDRIQILQCSLTCGNPTLKVTPNSKAGTRKEKTMELKTTIMSQFVLGAPVFRTEWFWEDPSLPVWAV